ncbi:MAG TPA: HlyD family secretion protein [Dokdonella sp.]|uniref:HlyD family secretion protein n=1 Tax=Dokdonella sp. TaxID=2291710 RepID=UPI002D7F6E5E|nr:HlyD family secretion protein [Dokdonella sp.]HET9033193.1 HlyD family secretion protein [Dokdonella sp.]
MTSKQQIEILATDEASEPMPKRKRSNRILWIAGPLVVALIAGWFYLTAGRYSSTDNAYVQADQVTIAAQVAGRVVEVAVHENQPVRKGDLLFRIDPEPLQIAVEQMQAQIAAAGDYLNASRDTFRSASADLRASEATLRNHEAQLKRIRELRSRGLVAQKALDDAINDVTTARGTRDSDSASLAKSRTMLGGAVDTPLNELSGYRVVMAQLAKAKLDLSHAEVRAPIDGTIGKMHLQPGDYLNVGQAAMPLVSNSLWVEGNFKETDLTNVRVGQAAEIEVDTYPGHKWKATVSSISPASGSQFSILPAQNATGNWVKIVQRIPVRLSIDTTNNAGLILRAGMSAEVEIDTGAENSLLGRWTANQPHRPQLALDR